MAGVRLDQALVAQGLARSRGEAQALVEGGRVSIDGAPADKPARRVADDAALAVTDGPRWVGRGALKLLHALDAFGLDPRGARALDLGASTGGFTEALLARGATHVDAVDVGRDQLAPSLRADLRVTPREGVDARALPEGLAEQADWIVADLSFIALVKALPPALSVAQRGAILVALVKPQFEAGRAAVGRGGVVRDPAAQEAACAAVRAMLHELGWTALGQTESPITGGDGNREFLIAARR
jgi:23S rRNA (cytidine1920-2'-O)/16S rRNA (cytidine1409-2'-O)-methyltransferase